MRLGNAWQQVFLWFTWTQLGLLWGLYGTLFNCKLQWGLHSKIFAYSNGITSATFQGSHHPCRPRQGWPRRRGAVELIWMSNLPFESRLLILHIVQSLWCLGWGFNEAVCSCLFCLDVILKNDVNEHKYESIWVWGGASE